MQDEPLQWNSHLAPSSVSSAAWRGKEIKGIRTGLSANLAGQSATEKQLDNLKNRV